MFPLTHLYTAKEVLGYENAMTALGAMFPDFGSVLGAGRNLCHEMGVDMWHYAMESDKDHADFALGVLTHGTALPGIDWYADESYHGLRPGFCFQLGEEIAAEAAKACNLPPNMAVWKAHNIIEMAFDVITERKHPCIGAFAYGLLVAPPETVCTGFLQNYLRCTKEDTVMMFRDVLAWHSFDGNDIEDMATKFIVSLERRHGITHCHLGELLKLIEKAVLLIEPLYDAFMTECLTEISANLQKLTGVKRL